MSRINGQLSQGTEYLTGTDSDDDFYPLGGSDVISGRNGFDTVVVAWPSTGFKITSIGDTTYLDTISGASTADKVTLFSVESLQFSDRSVSLVKNQTFANYPGSELFKGGWGLDSARYELPRAQYVITQDATGLDVRHLGTEGTDRLVDIERVHFKDQSVAFDLQGHAGTTLKVLGAIFGPASIKNKTYAGIGLDCLDRLAYTEQQLADLALQSRLGNQAQDPRQVVPLLYSNITGLNPSPDILNGYLQQLANGEYTIQSLTLMAMNTEQNKSNVGLVGVVHQGLEYLPVV